MLEFFIHYTAIFWVIVAVIFAIVEGATMGLVTIWFTVGGGAAALAAVIGAPFPVQVAVFFIVSVVLLIFTRPLFVKRLRVGKEKNYTEQLEGKPALVTEDIGPFHSGLAKVNGIVWTAVGETEEMTAAKGERVTILRVEGVKLIVRPRNESDQDTSVSE